MSRPAVLVLAGGASNRVWPLRDKLLLEFGSQTLLERHLRQLRGLDCTRVVVVARPDNAAEVETILASLGVEGRVVIQPEPRGMADAVLCSREALQVFGDDSLYVTQAHDVVDAALHAAMLEALESGVASGYLAAQRVTSYFPGGYLTLNGPRVTSVVEKPEPGSEPSDLVNIVAHGFCSWHELVASIEAETEAATAVARQRPAGWSPFPEIDDVYERSLTRLMAGSEFHAVVYEGRWQALKYPWHLLDVMQMLLERWTSGVESPGPDYEQREDGVFIGRDVRIFPGAYVVGQALIGHGSVIGHNALVRDSIVGPNCVVGFGSEVARSYLAAGVELHHNYVGDSILDRGSAMGFGATTANFRIDGRTVPSRISGKMTDSARMKLGLVLGAGTHVGVNTSTMPGIKIGAGATVGANLRISKDLPDGARLLDERAYGRF